MRNVIIFRELLLPPSETFVLAQARSLSRYSPVFCGLTDVPQPLPVPHPIHLTERALPFSRLMLEGYRRLQWAPRFHQRVRQAKPALIHSHFAVDATDALGLQQSVRVPLVVTLHGFDVATSDETFALRPSGCRFLRRRPRLWQTAAHFICVSRAIRDMALHAGYPEQKLSVRYIGIDCDRFQPALEAGREDNLILFVGRLVEKKGGEYLIRAVGELRDRGIPARLVMVGDGALRAELEQLAQELHVPAEFEGVQKSDTVRSWMRRARVLCNPSVTARSGDSEGLLIVLAEAQAMGLPVVSTRHSGIPEIVRHGETGLLAAERSVAELSSHLERMLTDRPFWSACSQRASAWIRESFDIRKCTAGLEEVYDQAVREGNTTASR